MSKKNTVAFFTVGSAIKFNEKNILRSDGTCEYYMLLKLLLKNPTIERVVLLSKSDWGRISEGERRKFDPLNKLYDPFTEIPELSLRKKTKSAEDKVNYYVEFHRLLSAKNLNIDFGVGFISQGWGTIALDSYSITLNPPYRLAKSLDMTLYYASEAIFYLNKNPQLKWWLLATDPRYVKPSMRHRDIVNLPQSVLGQQDFDINWYCMKELKQNASVENDDFGIKEVKSKYAGIEKMTIMNKKIVDPSVEKPDKFTIVSMQLSAPSSITDLRYDILKEYILDQDVDKTARIFGKWSDFYKTDNPQFKGYIATEVLDKTFTDTRYTIVLPTKDGWVTSKYSEMLQLGVVPFLHPGYDNQFHIVPKDHPLRLKNAADFYKKMEYFDANPDKRIQFVRLLQKELISDAYTGKFMIDLINTNLKEANIDMQLEDFGEALFNGEILFNESAREPIVKTVYKSVELF